MCVCSVETAVTIKLSNFYGILSDLQKVFWQVLWYLYTFDLEAVFVFTLVKAPYGLL